VCLQLDSPPPPTPTRVGGGEEEEEEEEDDDDDDEESSITLHLTYQKQFSDNVNPLEYNPQDNIVIKSHCLVIT